MRKIPKISAIDQVEQDFIDALERLQNNKPNESSLKKKSLDGKLKINVSTVAKESGHSRTLIGHADCKYPNTRQKVLSATARTPPTSASTVLKSLRQENEALRAQVQTLISHHAALVRRMHALEAQLQRERMRHEITSLKAPPNIIIGETISKDRDLMIKLNRQEADND